MARLTPRQERFVAAFIETGSGAEAARRARYSARSARAIAHENLTKPDITAEIERRRAEVAREHEVTVDKLVAELREARGLAMKLGRPSAAVAATMAIAKLCGVANGTQQDVQDQPAEEPGPQTPEEMVAYADEMTLKLANYRAMAQRQLQYREERLARERERERQREERPARERERERRAGSPRAHPGPVNA